MKTKLEKRVALPIIFGERGRREIVKVSTRDSIPVTSAVRAAPEFLWDDYQMLELIFEFRDTSIYLGAPGFKIVANDKPGESVHQAPTEVQKFMEY